MSDGWILAGICQNDQIIELRFIRGDASSERAYWQKAWSNGDQFRIVRTARKVITYEPVDEI